MKKESAKRGYMNIKDVEVHLQKYHTDTAKVRYLDSVLKKEKLLASETRNSVKYLLNKYYDSKKRQEVYLDDKSRKEMLDLASDEYRLAEEEYHNGNFDDGCGHGLVAAELFMDAGNIEKARKITDGLAKLTKIKFGGTPNLSKKYGRHLMNIWIDEGEPDKAVSYYSSGVSPDQTERAAKFLEESGYLTQARRLRKKVRGDASMDLTSRLSSAAAVIGVLGGLFFLSPNITGNAIANVSQSSGNILGAVLLVVGLVAGFFWVKKK